MIILWTDVNQEKIDEFRDVLEGVYFTGNAKLNFDPFFVEKFKEKFDSEPNLYSALGYMWAGVYESLLSVEDEKQHGIEEIISFVNEKTESAVIKGFKYNEEGDVELPMQMLQVQKGVLEEVYVS